MSLKNTSDTAQEIKLTLFNVGVTEDAFDTDPRCVYDADISTCFFCSKAALDYTMPVPEGSTEMLTVGNARCNVTNATLYEDGEHVRRYKITPGAKEVRITHPKQTYAFLNEVIFK